MTNEDVLLDIHEEALQLVDLTHNGTRGNRVAKTLVQDLNALGLFEVFEKLEQRGRKISQLETEIKNLKRQRPVFVQGRRGKTSKLVINFG